jgi:hypothetical protein
MRSDLSVAQARFLEYLLDPRTSHQDEPQGKGSQTNLAKRLQLSPTTLTKWKKDPAFLRAWEEKHRSVTGGIQRYSEMLERLYQIGMGNVGGTRAADMRAAIMNYFELVGRHQPKQTIEIKDASLLALTDEDVASRLKAKLRVIEGGKSKRKVA